MAGQKMRAYEMTEIVHRGLGSASPRRSASPWTLRRRFPLGRHRRVRPWARSRHRHPRAPGGLSARELLDAVRRICLELPVVGMDVVEVAPPYDHAEITRPCPTGSCSRPFPRWRASSRTSATGPGGTRPNRSSTAGASGPRPASPQQPSGSPLTVRTRW